MQIASDPRPEELEIEWQFDALDLRPAARWLAALASAGRLIEPLGQLVALAKPTVVQEDLYLDTEDWRMAQAGYVLRVRNAKGTQEVTLKALERNAPRATGLPHRRREVNEPVTEVPGHWLEAAGPVGWRVTALVGKRELQTVLEVHTRRRPFVLRLGDEDVAEVALDETHIAIDDQNPMRLLRVEVEVEAPWVEVLTPVVRDLERAAGLTPASLSKFEAGVLARGYVLPDGIDLGETSVSSSSSIGAVADAVIRRNLRALLEHEAGTRLGEDTEELHDMRVATRRLRAAFDVFSDMLPPHYRILNSELAWLAGLLGAVRDLDVQIEHLEASPEWHGPWASPQLGVAPLAELRTILATERDRGRSVLLQALDSPRYERLTTALTALAQQGPAQRSAAGHLPATVVAPELLVVRHDAARRAARRARRSGAAADFHRLRIRCKRLRYALEFVEDVYGDPARQFVRQLTRLQDVLGGLQDAQVSMERLHSLATLSQPPLSRPTVFLMGAAAEAARQEGLALLHQAGARLGVLRGDEWERLSRGFDRRERSPAGPAGPQDHGAPIPPALAPPAAPLPPSVWDGEPPERRQPQRD